MDLLDLGPRRLRDLPTPVQVFQVQAERCDRRATDRARIVDTNESLDGVRMRPDLVIQKNGRTVAVADVKYRRTDDIGDFQQPVNDTGICGLTSNPASESSSVTTISTKRSKTRSMRTVKARPTMCPSSSRRERNDRRRFASQYAGSQCAVR